MIYHFLAAAFVAVFTFSSAISATPEIQKPSDIPVEAFAALPTFDHAQLSPDGKRVAYYLSHLGRRHIYIQTLKGADPFVIPPWRENMEIVHFFWKTDDTIIFKVSMTLNRAEFYSRTEESRTISVNIKTKKTKWLGRPETRRSNSEYMSQHERIIDRLPDDPEHLLLQLDFELDAQPDVYKVNINTGRRKKVKTGKKGVNNWYADQSSEIRLGIGYKHKSTKRNVFFKNTDGKWVNLENVAWADKYDIEDFSPDPNILYVKGLNEHGTESLYTLDVRNGKIVDHIFTHPTVDMSGTYQHPVTGKLAGVTYMDEYYKIEYLDKDLKALQLGLQRAIPGLRVTITSKAKNANTYLIYASNETHPGDYYYYDRDTRKLSWVTSTRAQIPDSLMAEVITLNIPVRDGTKIPSFLTKPYKTAAQNLPTIILPHGGPHARDSKSWGFEAQFYASRGYLVLQPNFRGSSGYGPAFESAGNKQWGGLMQDDVTDATKWLIEQGLSDPERICIVGSSYGGYAALMGVIKEQGLYKCAISVNGVTNIPALKQHDRGFVGGRAWIKNMGLKDVPDKQVSPHHRAEDINVPVLLMSSKDDMRIPYRHSKSTHNRMKKLKKNSTYIEIKNGTHYMHTAQSRLTMLRASEKFLAEHIGHKTPTLAGSE